jgi:hypothetical protein
MFKIGGSKIPTSRRKGKRRVSLCVILSIILPFLFFEDVFAYTWQYVLNNYYQSKANNPKDTTWL